MTRLLIPLWWK